ncbi:MAG: PAS domain-containing protein [Nocardioides sp.]
MVVEANEGIPLDPAGTTGLDSGDVPTTWRESGIRYVDRHLLPGHAGVLVLAWRDEPVQPDPALEVALAALDSALARRQVEAELEDLVARVDHAQHLANMGDYDWHIATDTNRWSDQLFRIYGHEPQTFNASYDRFLSLIHPDDRDGIVEVHQQAYRTGEPYQMIERIVRPDGEVRHLLSNGQVLMDSDRTPLRFRGTCIDVTDRVVAEQAREHIDARFRGLVESAPDAILVLDDEGRILEANPRAHELLGGAPAGHQINEFLPPPVRDGALGVPATGLDGRALLLDVITAEVTQVDTERLVAVFLRDARVRLAGEAMAARLSGAQLRRRQALEINDNVVQGLVAAAYALELDDAEQSATYLTGTLAAARTMMDDLLDPHTGAGTTPGDLVRSTAAIFEAEDEP